MCISVRQMTESEVDLIIDYFHASPTEHLELIGVDPARLPQPEAWRSYYAATFQQPVETRETLLLTWLDDDRPVGFSSADKIAYGDHAHMHLHVTTPGDRRRGLGVEAVKRSVALYFEQLKLKRLFCKPHALNAAPNLALGRVQIPEDSRHHARTAELPPAGRALGDHPARGAGHGCLAKAPSRASRPARPGSDRRTAPRASTRAR